MISEENILDFVKAVRDTDEYRKLKETELSLKKEPALLAEARRIRRQHYELLLRTPDEKLLEEEIRFADENESVYNNPRIHDYLEAEAELNRLLRDCMDLFIMRMKEDWDIIL
ncbi:MAG: YlbF family regulator [Lachnospiraceae bacterium]|nr:YlbF family regulator [Lachnospiraceae bacterium]